VGKLSTQIGQRSVGFGEHRVLGIVLRPLRRARTVPVSEQSFGHLLNLNTPVSESIISAQNGIWVNQKCEVFLPADRGTSRHLPSSSVSLRLAPSEQASGLSSL